MLDKKFWVQKFPGSGWISGWLILSGNITTSWLHLSLAENPRGAECGNFIGS